MTLQSAHQCLGFQRLLRPLGPDFFSVGSGRSLPFNPAAVHLSLRLPGGHRIGCPEQQHRLKRNLQQSTQIREQCSRRYTTRNKSWTFLASEKPILDSNPPSSIPIPHDVECHFTVGWNPQWRGSLYFFLL